MRFRQKMEIGDGNVPLAVRAAHVHHGFQRGERDAHVGRMRGDARVAGAENGVHARPAADRRAAAAGLALVAGGGEVPVVGAARSLQEVPSHGRDVAQLRRGACEDRLCEHRQALLDPGMLGDLGVRRHRVDAHAVLLDVDLAQVQPAHVHHVERLQHLDLHQIDERSAPGEECRVGPRAALHCRFNAVRALVGDPLHGYTLPFALRTASTMLGYAPQRQMLPLIPSRISSSVRPPPSLSRPMAERICPGVQ